MALPVPLVRPALLLLVALPFCAAHPGPVAFPAPRHFQSPALHSDGFGLLARRSIAEAPTDINVTTNSSFVLAADRTYRKDPLNGFRKYTGGWNISEVHYFAEPERQISPSPCTGHGIWFKHIGQEGKPAILGATHPCSSTKHIPAAKNLL